jgi:putative endonuclease
MKNKSGTLYVGMTNDLRKRVAQHKEMLVEGFTKRYRITTLIYFEEYDDVRYCIERETRKKAWTRRKKLDLIATMNPSMKEIIIN